MPEVPAGTRLELDVWIWGYSVSITEPLASNPTWVINFQILLRCHIGSFMSGRLRESWQPHPSGSEGTTWCSGLLFFQTACSTAGSLPVKDNRATLTHELESQFGLHQLG